MTENLVEVSDLWVSYRRAFHRESVLEGVEFNTSKGEIVAIVGRNGEGKTTLFRSVMGLQAPDKGNIRVGGLSPDRYRRARGIGFLPETYEFPGSWTVSDLLGRGVDLSMPAAVRPEAFRLAVERGRFDQATLNRTASRCSKGIRQRLALAYALIGEPEVVLLDEPFSGLDPPSRIAARNEITQTAERGATVLLASHDLAEVQRLATTVFLIREGTLQVNPQVSGEGKAPGGDLEAAFMDGER